MATPRRVGNSSTRTSFRSRATRRTEDRIVSGPAREPAGRACRSTNNKRTRALDCFTFNGAFALHLASVCENVIGIDISADAVAAARRNAQLNEFENVDFLEANVSTCYARWKLPATVST